MNVDGAAPFLMTQATTTGAPTPPCEPPTPTLLTADPGHSQVTLTWNILDDPNIAGYKLYYDQAGKAQLVADINTAPLDTYTDTDLTNGQEYCYKVTSYYDATCESGFSNILCAIPNNQGQTNPKAGVDQMQAGYWSGKGKNQTWSPSPIPAGQTVVIRARVLDRETSLPISNATVEITIGGPETVTHNSGPSDVDGWAEATWQTKAAGRKQPGTTPGDYTATVSDVTASGYNWDSVTTSATFTIQ